MEKATAAVTCSRGALRGQKPPLKPQHLDFYF